MGVAVLGHAALPARLAAAVFAQAQAGVSVAAVVRLPHPHIGRGAVSALGSTDKDAGVVPSSIGEISMGVGARV
jgi:hypothetical protein